VRSDDIRLPYRELASPPIVIAGLDPAIHAATRHEPFRKCLGAKRWVAMDVRPKPAQDGQEVVDANREPKPVLNADIQPRPDAGRHVGERIHGLLGGVDQLDHR
jgi:hypothetical protein